jgi:N-acetylglucosamine kinase-like BadF-type ATPase
MQKGLLAGFDAGQTHTRCRLAQVDGTPLAEGEGSGVSHLSSSGGPERLQQALLSSLQAARQSLAALQPNLSQDPLLAAAVGASGIEAESPSQTLGTSLASEALGLNKVRVCGDERTALAGAFANGEPGIVLISGTGAIAVGRNRDGEQHRCAGWGWLVDGVGSAMDIGRDGLALTLRMADGRLEETTLKRVLWGALGVRQAHELKALVVDPHFGAAGFARLAPLVSAEAQAGDPHARAVLAIAGEELALMVEGVATALGLSQPAVCCLGGAIEHFEPLQFSLRQVLEERLPGAELKAPLGDACSGALAIAAEELSR